MDLHLGIYELAERHGLDGARQRRLRELAGIDGQPEAASRWMPRGAAVLAAALFGLGVIFWVAANWADLGRFGRFALLQGTVLSGCALAWARPAARVPAALVALLGIGGLFAYFGQTYQTGADPWQLFALWAALALPLCLAVRSDALWTPWALIVATAVSLWVHAHVGHRWTVKPGDMGVHAAAWGAVAVLVGLLAEPLRRFTGAGMWSLRTALLLAVTMIGASALGGLFDRELAATYPLGLAVLGMGTAAFATPRNFDLFGLSAIALALNTLLVVGLARLLFDNSSNDFIGSLFILGLAATGLLASTVTALLKLSRRHAASGDAA